MKQVGDYFFDQWLDENMIRSLPSGEFWDNEEEETSKEWYILDGNFEKMENYIRSRRLVEQLDDCIAYLRQHGNELSGIGVDLGAGNLWAEPHLLKNTGVEKIYAIEFSRHRLLKLGPAVLRHYGVRPDQVVLVVGQFEDIRLDDASVDFIFMSAAFHHAACPTRLLAEMKRVLREGGTVILIGEDYQTRAQMLKRHILRYLASRLPIALQLRFFKRPVVSKSLFCGWQGLKIEDPVVGDRMYYPHEYRQMFSRGGFRYKMFRSGSDACAFVLSRLAGE